MESLVHTSRGERSGVAYLLPTHVSKVYRSVCRMLEPVCALVQKIISLSMRMQSMRKS